MKKSLLFLLILFSASTYSQKKAELGRVTVAELQEKTHPLDSSAAAAVIFRKGKTSFEYSEGSFYIVTDVEAKIKIYKKEGLGFANQSVPYYVGSPTKEKVSFSKAVTYNLVNGAVEKTKLKSEGEFEEKVNKFNANRKIAMPNVKEGSIIEFAFTIKSPYIANFPAWQFQSTIPVNYSEYTANIPEYFFYNIRTKGSLAPVQNQSSGKRSIEYFERDRLGTESPMSRGGRNLMNTTQTMVFDEKRTTYTLENIPALKEEGFVNNIENYTATLLHELSSIHYPYSEIKNFSTTWEVVAKTIFDNENFGAELDKKSYFEADLDAELAGVASDADRIYTVFEFVKSRMNWNEYYGYTCDDGVKTAYKNKTGNVAEINLMLTAMLRYVHINANPVLLSTRSHGISYFPSKSAFNYVVCGVMLGDKTILLDATSKNAHPDILPFRDLNWVGRMIASDGRSAEIDLMPKSNSKEIVNMAATLDAEGKLSGKIKSQYFDYNAFGFRETYNSISKDSYLEKLEKRFNGIEIGDYEAINNHDLTKPLIENYGFVHNAATEVISGKIYLSPLLFFADKENPFKQEKREYPVDFVYPRQDKYMFTITIPDGYIVESLPAPLALAMDNRFAKFVMNISASANQIQVLTTTDINGAIIGPEYYQTLKDFYKTIIEKQNEKIVLKRV